jgi:hypothetical protein
MIPDQLKTWWWALPVAGVTQTGEPTPSDKDKDKARQSWYADLVWTLLNILFLIAWLYQITEDKGIFDEQFMTYGFCNTSPPDPPDGKDSPTQIGCFGFDWSMALAVVLAALKIWKVVPSWGSVVYLLVHGLAHGLIFVGVINPDQDIETPLQIAILAVILAMGAYGIYATMVAAGKPSNLAIAIAVLADVFFTGVFVKYLTKGVYVLTYVNIAINLCIMGSRLLLVGPNQVVSRLSLFGPYFNEYIVTCTLMIAVMWIEPTMCSEGFAEVGGHVWFDVSLFALMLVGILNANANAKKNNKSGTKKES